MLFLAGMVWPMGSELAAWLRRFKARGGSIEVTDDCRVRLGGPRLWWGDHRMAAAHRAGLVAAVDGRWDVWWRYVSGKSDHAPKLVEVPWAPDPSSRDGKAFACVTCGRPAVRIDGGALAWCVDHRAPVRREAPTVFVDSSLFEEAA